MHYVDWIIFLDEAKSIAKHKYQKKKKVQIAKYNNLVNNTPLHVKRKLFKCVEPINNFVRNLSSETFNPSELNLLNRGFNFAIQPANNEAIKNTLIDFEVAIGMCDDEDEKTKMRCDVVDNIKNTKLSSISSEMSEFKKVSKSLRDKKQSVFFTKADKSNNIVILDKDDYIQSTENFIRDGPYEQVNYDPLPGMIRRTKTAVKESSKVFVNEPFFTLKMHVSNPIIPRLYTQLKLHKPGNKVRPITPNNNAPTEKLAIWLLNKFNSMKLKFESASIKNSIEFVNKIKNEHINDNEMQLSFDIENMYPNVPITQSLDILNDWLVSNNEDAAKVHELVKLTRLCMEENWFQFNGNFYKQNHGCCMGSPLSPFIANLFMSHFETELKNDSNFPRIWHRYVDDVWAVIKKQKLRQFMNRINNSKYATIKFTYEEENNSRLNFLDVTVIRNENKFEFDIFRKPTNTGRYITSDSYHPIKHKLAAFHCMIHRALNIPLTYDRLESEIENIKTLAHVNGYTEQMVNELITAHQRKRELRDHTTLSLIRENHGSQDIAERWSSFNFHSELSNKIRPILCKQNIKISECSKSKLSNIIGGSKDIIDKHNQSGIYSIICKDCNKQYIGQTRRSIIKRFKEHKCHTEHGRSDDSSVAKHMVDFNHNMDLSCLKLIHRVDNFYELNAYESFYINKFKDNLMNENNGPIQNSIFSKFYS